MADKQSLLGDLIPQVKDLIQHLQTIREHVETKDLSVLPKCPTTSYPVVQNRLTKCIKKLRATIVHTAFRHLMGRVTNDNVTVYSIDEENMKYKCLSIVDQYIAKADLTLRYCQETSIANISNIDCRLTIKALEMCHDALQLISLPEFIMKIIFHVYGTLHPFYTLMLHLVLHYKKLQDIPDSSPAA